MKLYYPIKPVVVSQPFGACHASVCNKYKAMGLAGHNGIDMYAGHGMPVRAAHDGTVVFAGEDGSAGYGVVIRTDTPEADGRYMKSIYWHLSKSDCHEGKHGIPVKAGQKIKAGFIVGYADNTGMSTGDHLHFGIKPVYKGEEDWSWWNAEQDNGYKGAIDPNPFFNGIYAEDYLRSQLGLFQKLLELLQKLYALTKTS